MQIHAVIITCPAFRLQFTEKIKWGDVSLYASEHLKINRRKKNSPAKSENDHKHIFHFNIKLSAAFVQHAQEFHPFQVFCVLLVEIFHGFDCSEIGLESLPRALDGNRCNVIL